MTKCGVCGEPCAGIMCKGCYAKWPKGVGLFEYIKQPPVKPVVYPSGYGTADDAPPEWYCVMGFQKGYLRRYYGLPLAENHESPFLDIM